MLTINKHDFDILKRRCITKMESLNIPEEVSGDFSNTMKERLGFYHLIVQNVTGHPPYRRSPDEWLANIEEGDELLEGPLTLIMDSDYNKQVYDIKDIDDLGVDVIHIDDTGDTIDIQLFNFKYRENFKPDNNISENDIERSFKFFTYLDRDKSVGIHDNHPIVLRVLKVLNSMYENRKDYKIQLHMVSNCGEGFASNTKSYIQLLEEKHDIEINSVTLLDIKRFFNPKDETRESVFKVEDSNLLQFKPDSKSSRTSYVVSLQLFELLRITSEDAGLSQDFNLEEDELVFQSNLDLNLLHDNVRGYLGHNKGYNKNIFDTLDNSPENFFLFNNGLTITAKYLDVVLERKFGKYKVTLNNFQIVNGGQTLRTIYEYAYQNKDNLDKLLTTLYNSRVLVRLLGTLDDPELQTSIAEYTNSQNAISSRDLKSVDSIQIHIEEYFREHDILYLRKTGSNLDDQKVYSQEISLENLTKAIYSSMGFPERVSNMKQKLFTVYYNEIFKQTEHDMAFFLSKAREYFHFKNYLDQNKSSAIKFYEQKIYYLIYLKNHPEKIKLTEDKDLLDFLHAAVITYKEHSALTEARKMIQKGFKDHLDSKLESLELPPETLTV